MSDTQKTELRDRILKERDAGRIVFWGLPDELMAANLNDFLKQPVDGILYDLNRGEEVVLTFLDDPKWVNDFAVATVIRRLVAELSAKTAECERLDRALEEATSTLRYYANRENWKHDHFFPEYAEVSLDQIALKAQP